MLEMSIRTGRRVQDAVRRLQDKFDRDADERQQVNSLHRQRMSCSDSLRSFTNTQDWTLGMGMSPSYFVHCFGKPSKILGSDVDPKALASKLMEDPNAIRPRVYMACGSEDFLIENNRSLHEHLEKIGYPHHYTEGHGTHAWEYWDPHIEEGLKWMEGQL